MELDLKTLLITPHQYLDATHDYVRLKQPLGLALLKENVKANISIIDSFAEGYDIRNIEDNILRIGLPLEDLIKRIEKEKADVVGISNLWSSNYPAAEEIAQTIKKKLPQITTVLGGVHPSFTYKTILEKNVVDYIAIREAAATFPQLLQFIEGKITWQEVTGIARKYEGNITTPTPPKNTPLKDLNPINYHIFSPTIYAKQKKFGLGDVINADFVSSLGCPHTCDYCSTKQMWPGKFRTYSEEQLNFMFDSIKEAGYNFVSIQDDNLAAQPKNGKTIMKLSALKGRVSF